MSRLALSLGLVLCLAAPALAQMEAFGDATALAGAYCTAARADDQAQLRALASPDLLALIERAEAADATFAAANPGDKPPLGDGIPWRSVPDAITGCDVMGVRGTPDGTEVLLMFSLPDALISDRLRVVATDGQFRIDDVIYETGSSLRAVLEEVGE